MSTASPPTTPSTVDRVDSDSIKVYHPDRSQWFINVVMISSGLYVIWDIFKIPGFAFLFLKDRSLSNLLITLGLPGSAVFLLLVGVRDTVDAIRGFPLLMTSPRGIRLDSTFDCEWADWDSLGTFTVKVAYTRRGGQSAGRRQTSLGQTQAGAHCAADNFRCPTSFGRRSKLSPRSLMPSIGLHAAEFIEASAPLAPVSPLTVARP